MVGQYDAPRVGWRTGRRAFVGLGAGALTLASVQSCSRPTDTAPGNQVPFRGPHQGAVTVSGSAGLAGAFDILVEGRRELARLVADLSETIDGLMSDAPIHERGGGFPPLDTGLIDPHHPPTHTAVVLGLGASLFDNRFGLRPAMPPQLQPMPRFGNDRLVTPAKSDGDLSLTISATSPEAVVHATRQILRSTRGRLTPRWMQSGSNQVHTDHNGAALTGRNLMGFKDGTVNPDPGVATEMNEVVWVQDDGSLPAWMAGGSYQAIRVIRMLVEFWDRTRLSEQEAVFHRHRGSGAPLGAADEFARPGFADATALDSHIGRINPRRRDSPDFVMMRRGFNYANGLDENDQLDEGLVFVSYQNDLETGFLGTQRRLEGEALEEYVAPTGGGLFFVPPGPGEGEYLAQSLLG
ncbi:iron uptake transporter deferrochelatase/peroxidase subunit [Nocardioides salsibiostraticola]